MNAEQTLVNLNGCAGYGKVLIKDENKIRRTAYEGFHRIYLN